MTQAALLQRPPACPLACLLAAAALVLHLAYTLHASLRILCSAAHSRHVSCSRASPPSPPSLHFVPGAGPWFAHELRRGPSVRSFVRPSRRAQEKRKGRKTARKATESRWLFPPLISLSPQLERPPRLKLE